MDLAWQYHCFSMNMKRDRSTKVLIHFFTNTIDKRFLLRFSRTGYVRVNGKHMSNSVINRAEKLAGTIQPGNYWLVYMLYHKLPSNCTFFFITVS